MGAATFSDPTTETRRHRDAQSFYFEFISVPLRGLCASVVFRPLLGPSWAPIRWCTSMQSSEQDMSAAIDGMRDATHTQPRALGPAAGSDRWPRPERKGGWRPANRPLAGDGASQAAQRRSKDPPTAAWGILACGTSRTYRNLMSFLPSSTRKSTGDLRMTGFKARGRKPSLRSQALGGWGDPASPCGLRRDKSSIEHPGQ